MDGGYGVRPTVYKIPVGHDMPKKILMYRKRYKTKKFYKRKRSYGKKVRSVLRKRARAIRIVTTALETKRRVFDLPIQDVAMSNAVGQVYALYNPLNYFVQGTNDAQYTGNGIYIKSFHLRGTVTPYSDGGTVFAGPLFCFIKLMKVRDELNTGVLSEGWTEGIGQADNWFVGRDPYPTQQFINKSRAQCVYRKRFQITPDTTSAFNTAGVDLVRATKAISFNLMAKINRPYYFKNIEAGTTSSGNFGRNYNYYWLVQVEHPLGYGDVQARLSASSMTLFKEI